LPADAQGGQVARGIGVALDVMLIAGLAVVRERLRLRLRCLAGRYGRVGMGHGELLMMKTVQPAVVRQAMCWRNLNGLLVPCPISFFRIPL